MPFEKVFEFYRTILKPIYVEIEARGNTLPVELLFETHATLDHLSRSDIADSNPERCEDKALSHLKRGALDAFKLKLKYANEDIRKFDSLKIDLSLIDNGDFLKNYYALKQKIKTTAQKARLEEKKAGDCNGNNSNIEEAFDNWMEVSTYIEEINEQYILSEKVDWAKRKTFKIISTQTVFAFIIGIITSIVGGIILNSIDVINIKIPAEKNNSAIIDSSSAK